MAVCMTAALALAACGKSDDNSSSNSGGAATSSTPAPATSAPAKEQQLGMKDFSFDPATVKGQPGQKVTLELKNEGKTEHNFTVESQHVNKDVEEGEDAKVTVTLPKSGTLQFFCEYHKAKGMVGTLSAGGASSTAPPSTNTGTTDDSGGSGY
jgi:plastocyanin